MRKIVYLPPKVEINISVRPHLICVSGPSIYGSYSDHMGEEGAPGGVISSDDVIDGGTF